MSEAIIESARDSHSNELENVTSQQRAFVDLLDCDYHSQSAFDSLLHHLFLAFFERQSFPPEYAWKCNQKLLEFSPHIKKDKRDLCLSLLWYVAQKSPVRWTPDLTDAGFLLIDPAMRSPEGATFELPYYIEMTALVFASGILAGSNELVNAGVQMALASLHLLDKDGRLPIGFGCPAYPLNEKQLRFLHAATLATLFRLTRNKQLEDIVGRLKPCLEVEVGPLARAIKTVLDSATEIEGVGPLEFHYEHDLGFCNLSDFKTSLILDGFGRGTPLGYTDYAGCEIRAFGFQYAPLGEMGTFGTFRMEENDRDYTQVQESETVTRYSGWSRLMDPRSTLEAPVPGAVFSHLTVLKEEDALRMRARLVDHDLSHKLYFTLYLKGEQVVVGGKEVVRKQRLKHFTGLWSPLVISGEGFEMRLTGRGGDEMRVIPLEGGEMFWGADFLIAYEISDIDRVLEWELRDLRRGKI